MIAGISQQHLELRQSVYHLEPASIPLMLYVMPPELLGFVPGFVVTWTSTASSCLRLMLGEF